MIDNVVNLVVAVDQCASILRLGFWISEKFNYILIVRSLAYWDLRLDIDRLGLRHRDGAKGLDLATVEARGLAKAGEADRGRRNAVKLCKRRDGILPPVHGEYGKNKYGVVRSHLVSVLGIDSWKRCILEYASIQEFHDIKGRSDYGCVLAQAVCFRDRDICAL